MAEENKTYLTEEGLKKLQDEYYNLVHVVREEVKQEFDGKVIAPISGYVTMNLLIRRRLVRSQLFISVLA